MSHDKREPSYTSLKQSLRAVTDEARGYLDQVVTLRAEVERLTLVEKRLEAAEFLIAVLTRALYEAQTMPRVKTNG